MGYKGEELADLAAPLERGVKRFGENLSDEVGKDLKRRVKRHTPVAKGLEGEEFSDFVFRRTDHRVPGTLRESWQIGEVSMKGSEGTMYTVAVFTLDPIAPHVEWDTKPHIIRPKKPGGTLAFEGETGTVFAKLVHHPGTKGAHMMMTALAEVAATWERTGQDLWAREARLIWSRG